MKLTIRRAAEQDVLAEIERYAALGVPQVAERFQAAVMGAFDLLCSAPEAGAPKRMAAKKLAGLRTWPIKGFDAFRIYYVVGTGTLDILRILHGRRDIARILDGD